MFVWFYKSFSISFSFRAISLELLTKGRIYDYVGLKIVLKNR